MAGSLPNHGEGKFSLCAHEEANIASRYKSNSLLENPPVFNTFLHGEPVAVPRPPPLFDSSWADKIFHAKNGVEKFHLCAHEESNLNYGIRNPVSYPLNDGRKFIILKSYYF